MKTKFNIGDKVLCRIGLGVVETISATSNGVMYNIRVQDGRCISVEGDLMKASKQGLKEMERMRLQSDLEHYEKTALYHKTMATEYTEKRKKVVEEMLKKGHRVIHRIII